jgi:hypothetical protein
MIVAATLKTITNISKQSVPILVNEIDLSSAHDNSSLAPTEARQISIPPGSELAIEDSRIDIGQLEQLRRLGLITFV